MHSTGAAVRRTAANRESGAGSPRGAVASSDGVGGAGRAARVTGVDAGADGAGGAERRLGARIRQLRTARGMTLVQVARATELSHPFLSQLERGLAQPSLASLGRIAEALETSPIELIAAAEATTETAVVHIARSGEGAVPDGFAAGEARLLAAPGLGFTPIEVVARRQEPGETYHHAEDEFVYVLAGALRVELDGERSDLEVGDAISFPGGVAHRWWARGGSPARLIVVKSAGPRRRPRSPEEGHA